MYIHSLQLYIEGYLQAMLDTMYRQEYLRVKVIDDQVNFKNLDLLCHDELAIFLTDPTYVYRFS